MHSQQERRQVAPTPAARGRGSELLTIRTLRPDDVAAVRGLVDVCSVGSIRHRFFGQVADPAALLATQVREAVWEGCAVGAYAGAGMVAVAVGLPDADETTWDLGVLVGDAWQSRRLGTRLACRLLTEAAAAGVTPVAFVEAANTRAMRLVGRLRRHPSGPALQVEVC